MGECLRHTITTPCVAREVLQRLGELLIDGTTADEQMAHLPQPFAFLRHLQRVPYLHGNHGSEEPTPIPSPREESRISLYCWEGIKIPLPWGGGRGGLAAQRVSTRFHADQSQTAFQRPHHHHLSGNVVERHAEQGRVARLQSQEVARHACRSQHASFLYEHLLRCTRRPTGLHPHIRRRAVPLFNKFFLCHFPINVEQQL